MHWSLVILFIGIALMHEPEPLDRASETPRMSAGTVCTLILAIPYFAVHLAQHAAESVTAARILASTTEPSEVLVHEVEEFRPPTLMLLEQAAKLAAMAVSLAPMLCVLFLGAQLVEDWGGGRDVAGHPRGFVELSMYICTVAVLTQLALAVVAPIVAGAELRPVGPNGELDFVTTHQTTFKFIGFLRWIVMTTLYIGVEVVCGSLWSPPEFLPLTRLLRHLAGCYFSVYAIQWFVISLRDISGGGFVNTLHVLAITKDVVAFCPMLAVLFLEAWARAQYATNARTGQPWMPQSYAQDSMYLAALAFLVQVLVVVLSGVISRHPVSALSHRQSAATLDSISFVLLVFFHLTTLVLCASIAVVIASLLVISPERANDASSLWVG
jgi:hypothetical protein